MKSTLVCRFTGRDAKSRTRVPSQDLAFFVIAVLIQRETGGNLTEVLVNISGIIRDRLKLHGRVRVLSAEGRLSALISDRFAVCCLPESPSCRIRSTWLCYGQHKIGLVMIYTSGCDDIDRHFLGPQRGPDPGLKE